MAKRNKSFLNKIEIRPDGKIHEYIVISKDQTSSKVKANRVSMEDTLTFSIEYSNGDEVMVAGFKNWDEFYVVEEKKEDVDDADKLPSNFGQVTE